MQYRPISAVEWNNEKWMYKYLEMKYHEPTNKNRASGARKNEHSAMNIDEQVFHLLHLVNAYLRR